MEQDNLDNDKLEILRKSQVLFTPDYIETCCCF